LPDLRVGRDLRALLLVVVVGAALATAAPGVACAQADSDSIARVGAARDYVTDQAGAFSDDGKVAIERYCGKVERALGVQFAVVTVRALGSESIEQFSERQFRQWGVGGKKQDQGLLLAIAVQDHGIRFEVGYGLEGALPDAKVGRVIRETLTPAFRAGHFDDGVLQALTECAAAVAQDKNLPAPVPDGRPVSAPGGNRGDRFPYVLLIFLAVVLLRAILSRGGPRGPRFFGGPFFWGGGGFGGGGFGGGFGGGSSGSGFGGFGGGSSGGGGASGSW